MSKKRIRKDQIEEAVINQVGADLTSDDFVNSLLAAAKKHASAPVPDESKLLTRRLKKVEEEINALMDMALEAEKTKPILAKVDKKETEREEIETQLSVYQEREAFLDAYREIDEKGIKSLLGGLSEGPLEK